MTFTAIHVLIALVCFGLGANSKEEMDYITYLPGYHKKLAPLRNHSESKEPFTIIVEIDVWAITEVSLKKQDIEVDLFIHFRWTDYRLTVNPNISSPRAWLVLGAEANEIWKPTFFFLNCKGCPSLSFATKKDAVVYVKKENGQLWSQHRVLHRFTCPIDLRAYPLDIQTCPIQMYIYEETDDVLRMQHRKPKERYTVKSKLSLSEYYLPPITKSECKIPAFPGYSCLQVVIRMEHLIAYHLMTSYAPTSFIVILSWISFWLPVDMAPARVALGLTSLLTLATRLDQAQQNLPPVAYVKAIDFWMFTCIFLVSASLCEFAVSFYRWRMAKLTATSNKANQIQPLLTKRDNNPAFGCPTPCHALPKMDKDGTTMDRASRVLFPVVFLLFNIVYWSYYLTYYD